MSKLLQDSLSTNRLRIDIANNAQKAIEMVDENIPDAIVAELQLTSHSGIEFLYELRSYKDLQRVPVIIYSIVPEEEFKDSRETLMEELNVIKYLEKESISLKTLKDEISKILKS